MRDIIEIAGSTLAAATYTVSLDPGSANTLLFENDTVLGFLIGFETTEELRSNWESVLLELVSRHQFALRASGPKAWNTYCVLLCREVSDPGTKTVLQSIEEDLTGTRKIVRSGVEGQHDVNQAILPLLPLQNAPELPVIDMRAEIMSRTTELPSEALEAFFSAAVEGVALQVIEEAK